MQEATIKIEKGNTGVLRGPCRAIISKGDLEVNGYPLNSGDLTIPIGRGALVLAIKDVILKGSCTYTSLPRETYDLYKKTSEKLSRYKRILLLGGTDTGKSTLASFLVNTTNYSYMTVDVGQNELFMPGYEALEKTPYHPFIPGSIDSESLLPCFVGSFSPVWDLNRYLYCASQLSRSSGKGIVIDTDGWVTLWEGAYNKAALASLTNADAIVITGGVKQEFIEVIEKKTSADTILLEKPLLSGVAKSRGERRTHRERLVAKRLSGSKVYSVSPERTRFYGLPVFTGKRLDPPPGALYAESSDDQIIIVYRGNARVKGSRRVRILEEGWEEGVIVNVECLNGKWSPGLIRSIDYEKKKVHIASKCMPKTVEVGKSRVPLSVLGSWKS